MRELAMDLNALLRSRRRRLRAGVADESGVALVLALAVMLVLAIALTATLKFTASSAGHANRSNADQKAYALAEAGVNAAASVLAGQNDPKVWSLYPTELQRTATVSDGTVVWSAAFPPTSCGTDCVIWDVTGRASVRNPTGPAAPVTRTVSARLKVDKSGGSGEFGKTFFYSKGLVSLTGGSATQEAIITDGDLKLTGGGWIDAAATLLSVRGTIDAGNSASFVGMNFKTNLTASMTATQNFATVASTANFASSGTIRIYNEYMTYTGTTPTSFTGLTRGALGTTPVLHATGLPDSIVSGAPPPTLTASMDATQTTANVTATAGFPLAGLVQIDNEYIKYTGLTSTSFTGLTRGYVPGFPAASHANGSNVDGRLAEVHTVGGCVGNCSQFHVRTPIDANLIQDTPAFTNVSPVFDIPQTRLDAAPGPNHQPPVVNTAPAPNCTISFAPGVSNPYYNGIGAVDLTPTTSYVCKATGPYGDGELSWDNRKKILKVRGVVFLPSGAKTSQGAMYDAPTPGATLYIAAKWVTGGVGLCGLRPKTTLTSAMTSTQNFANVASTAVFPAAGGVALIDDEYVTYSGKTATSLTGLARGRSTPGATSVAAAHTSGAAVDEIELNKLCDTTNWNPNTGNNLAIISETLPSPYDQTHDATWSGGAVFQGLIYTAGQLTVSGGGVISGTAWGIESITYSGGASAPAPSILALPAGFPIPPKYSISLVEGSFSG